jgi:hypothetical protein
MAIEGTMATAGTVVNRGRRSFPGAPSAMPSDCPLALPARAF